MKLSKFKMGDLIFRNPPSREKTQITGPFEFLGYEQGLLFASAIEFPETYIDKDQFLGGMRTVTIEGNLVLVARIEDSDDWFKFPTGLLKNIKTFLALRGREKKPEEDVGPKTTRAGQIQGRKVSVSRYPPMPSIRKPSPSPLMMPRELPSPGELGRGRGSWV